MIRVLIVDDSPVVSDFITYILESDPNITVIGTAGNGEEALELVRRKKPDLITMDIQMPGMNGIEATQRIMKESPTPIVIVTASHDAYGGDATFSALEAGALTVVEKPVGINHPNFEVRSKEFIKTVKLMSEVKVVTRRPRLLAKTERVKRTDQQPVTSPRNIRVVAIGSSTGGPAVLHLILSMLTRDFKAPILIVQHISRGFIGDLVSWIQKATELEVQVARDGEYILPGHVYFAPDDVQMGVDHTSRIILGKDESFFGTCPSVSYLFRSVNRVFQKNAIGVLLTGMGKDGTEELRLMREKGAITIVQDEKSSVVHGMPGQTIRINAAMHILSPEIIAASLNSLVAMGKNGEGGSI